MNLHESHSASPAALLALQQGGKASASNESDIEKEVFGKDGLTFKDFLDVINPLQHIPGVSTLYREMTGDEISPASRIGGGALFFGPVGAAISTANVIVDKATGKDVGEHVLAAFIDEENDGTILAGAEPIEAEEDTFVTAALQSWTNPGPEVETAANRPISDQVYRSLLAKGEPFEQASAHPNAESIAALKDKGEPFDLNPVSGAPISDTQLAMLMAQGEPFADVGGTEIDLSSAQAALPAVAQTPAQTLVPFGKKETVQQVDDLSHRTQAYANVGIDVREWASREVAERSRLARAGGSHPVKIAPETDLAGATAKEGGWFSDVMLSALKSYQGGNALTNSLAAPASGK
jgi:hypothetical protein